MTLYQTERLKKAAEEPTQLDIERIIDRRMLYRTPQEKNKLKWLEAGEEGEQIVLEYIKKYGKEDWLIVRNMWMSYGGPFEADFILLTNHGLYLIEVKNYTSDFSYKEGITSFNDQINSGNPIHQTRRNRINLERIVQFYSNRLPVYGALVLVGIDNYTEIHSKVEDIDIVKRTELRHYIQQIVVNEDTFQGKSLNKEYILKQLEKYEIDRNYGPEVVPKEIIDELQKGIQCPHCNRFNVEINRKTTFCPCGFKESREIAILRTICEYGVLTFNEHLRIGDLENFLGGAVSRNSLRIILNKYFQGVIKGRYTYYLNRKLPLYKLYEELNINDFIHLKMSYKDFENLK